VTWVVHLDGKFLSEKYCERTEDGEAVLKSAQWLGLHDPSIRRFWTHNEARVAAHQYPNATILWWANGLFFPPEAREHWSKLSKDANFAHQQKNVFKRQLYAANREANMLRRRVAELEARLTNPQPTFMARLWLALRGK
jgi:hypothetical protein